LTSPTSLSKLPGPVSQAFFQLTKEDNGHSI
jgi:hypothetical protein